MRLAGRETARQLSGSLRSHHGSLRKELLGPFQRSHHGSLRKELLGPFQRSHHGSLRKELLGPFQTLCVTLKTVANVDISKEQ